jgi:heavy metal sensor kinase
MKNLAIRTRLTLWYSLILAISLSIVCAVAYFAMRQSIRATVDAELHQKLDGIRGIIAENLRETPEELLDDLREYAEGAGSGVMLRVQDPRGQVLFASAEMNVPLASSAKHRNASLFYKSLPHGQFRVLSETVEIAGAPYAIQIAVSTEDFDRALDGFRTILYFAVPVFLVLAALGGYWMSRRALAPVDEITRDARNIGAHNLAQRLTVPRSGDELERLADTLNEMLARLDAAFQRITQFTADASHELRTPVSVLRTSAELTLRKPRTESEYRESLAQILQEAESVSRLIEQLLVLARADSGKVALPMDRLDLAQPLHKAFQQASVLAEAKQLQATQNIPAQPIWVRGDASSLERLFLILLDNAVKYTPEGGSIAVQVDANDGFAFVRFQDTGIGISPEDIPHIFDRFYRADRARSRETGGAGLGLAIGSWIAESHGGEIRVLNNSRHGSIFEVKLPLL